MLYKPRCEKNLATLRPTRVVGKEHPSIHPAGPKLSFRVDDFRMNTVWEVGRAGGIVRMRLKPLKNIFLAGPGVLDAGCWFWGCWMTQTRGLRGMDMDGGGGGGVFVVVGGGGGDTIPLRV